MKSLNLLSRLSQNAMNIDREKQKFAQNWHNIASQHNNMLAVLIYLCALCMSLHYYHLIG